MRNFQIELNYKCPYCKNNLQLIENRNFVIIGCEKCRIYIRIDKRELYKEIRKGISKNLFNWREILRQLYTLYVDEVCV